MVAALSAPPGLSFHLIVRPDYSQHRQRVLGQHMEAIRNPKLRERKAYCP
jgi:hypothetical protein